MLKRLRSLLTDSFLLVIPLRLFYGRRGRLTPQSRKTRSGKRRVGNGYFRNLAGQQRGASEIPVRAGWVLHAPLSTQIIEFATYVQKDSRVSGHHVA